MVVALSVAACSGGPTSPDRVAASNGMAVSMAPDSGSGGASRALAAQETPSDSDRDFVTFAAMANAAEIEFGVTAERLADLPGVKQFGNQMMQDHRAAQEYLRSIASDIVQSNIALDAAHVQTRTQLNRLSGSEFDRVYTAAMVQDHQTAITRFQQEARSGTSSTIRQYAQDMLPSLTAHLQLAMDLASRTR